MQKKNNNNSAKTGTQRAKRSGGVTRTSRPKANAPAKGTPRPKANKPVNASPCPVDATCGGCQNIAVPYDEQLVAKNLAVRDVLQREGLLSAGVSLRPILGMDEPFNYRNKVASPFARGRKLPKPSAKDKGRRNRLDCEVLTGMYVAGTHNLVNTNGCLIENEQANSVIAVIKSLMVRYGVQPYHEDSGTGFLRHAVVRVGHTTGEVLVTLVTNARDFPGSKQFCRELVKKCPFVTTVVQNVNTRQTNVILGTEEHVLYGPGFILDTLCGLSFRISSQSFYQVNATQTEVLYRVAVGFANLTGAETVIDAYCGTGTIGLVAAKSGAAQVIGVESVPSAVKDARTNAAHNGVENARFVVDDAESALRAWAAEGDMDPATTVLMMDPPRAGATEGFLQAACRLSPARIVYISCNPETQARDMAFLVRHGYTLRTVQPVDMFPHTPHVECVVLMTRIEPK